LIKTDRLKKKPSGKDKLINFRVESKLYEDFQNFCADSLDGQSVSDVLRNLMREVLIQNKITGYK